MGVELHTLYPYLILIGATMGAVLFYLMLQARRVSRANLALIRLNEQNGFDAPSLLRQAWPLLREAGVRGLRWRLDWFGMLLEQAEGKTDGPFVQRSIAVGEMQLELWLHLPAMKGERRFFGETLVETFLLLLRADMWIKAGVTDAAFAHMSRMSLFLQHDMKNVAQFIQLMADQVESAPSGKEAQVLAQLRACAPVIRERADRIVAALVGRTTPVDPVGGLFRFRPVLETLCRFHQLSCTIDGDGSLHLPQQPVSTALDNILKNYRDAALREPAAQIHLDIVIAQKPQEVVVTISAPALKAPDGLERLFEPFWSSDPNGLGIGLYQARQLVGAAGGTLAACVTPAGALGFRMVCREHA